MGAGRQETPLSRSKVAAVVCRMASIGHGAPWPSSPVHGGEIEGAHFYFWGPIAYAIISAIGFLVARSIVWNVAILGIFGPVYLLANRSATLAPASSAQNPDGN